MTRRFAALLLIALAVPALAGCWEQEIRAKPAAAELTREATGHYCQMIVVDHLGPKAQIHLVGSDEPLWFTQIRDAVAFTMLPEETREIAAIYVTDMGSVEWDEPPSGNWIAAEDALFVIESAQHGGMGASEAVPFGDRGAAEEFAARHGGQVVAFGEIPKDYVLAPVDVPDMPHGAEG